MTYCDADRVKGPRLFAFKGTYYYSIDQKGRISIPAKFRDKTAFPDGEPYVVTKGLEPCLYIYPKETWLPIQEKLYQLQKFNLRTNRFLRNLLGNADDTHSDKLGRMTIPQVLLDLACIKKDVVIIGVLDKIEVWDPVAYQNFQAGHGDQNDDDMAKNLTI